MQELEKLRDSLLISISNNESLSTCRLEFTQTPIGKNVILEFEDIAFFKLSKLNIHTIPYIIGDTYLTIYSDGLFLENLGYDIAPEQPYHGPIYHFQFLGGIIIELVCWNFRQYIEEIEGK